MRNLWAFSFLLLALAPASAQEAEDYGLYRGLDSLLERTGGHVQAPAGDEIASKLEKGRTVTVEVSTATLNVDAAAEILEVLEGDKYRVRTGSEEKILKGDQLKRLNLPYVIADGAAVLPGNNSSSGPVATVDRRSDKHLQDFLKDVKQVAAGESSDLEKIRRLTDLVNERVKYPKSESPGDKYEKIDREYRGRAVRFGAYLEAGEGVCRHKALAMKLALEEIGIQSRYVAGDALDANRQRRDGHAWVEAITSEGKRLLVDPTWHDPGIPLEEAYLKDQKRRPTPSAKRIVPPGAKPFKDGGRISGTPDMFDPFRDAQGLVQWKKVPADFLRTQARGSAHFAFALFLTELPGVLRSGEPERLSEFGEVLSSLDFYATYGLFSVGAASGEYLYDRLALRNSAGSRLAKLQLALAAGILLPQLVREGRDLDVHHYMLDVGALGLSAAAVRTALMALEGRLPLARLQLPGLRGKALVWTFSAAETALVITLGSELQGYVSEQLARRALRQRIRQATEALLALPPNASQVRVQEALDRLTRAFDDWRTMLYASVRQLEIAVQGDLEKVGSSLQRAQVAADAARRQVAALPSMKGWVERRYGSVEAYSARWTASPRAKLEKLLKSLGRRQTRAVRQVYLAERRAAPYLEPGQPTDWVLAGGFPQAPGAPTQDRARVREAVLARIESPSSNRMQVYEDERLLLARVWENRPAWGETLQARFDQLDAALQVEREVLLPFVQEGGLSTAVDGVVDWDE